MVRTEGALEPFLWIHAEQDDAGDKVVLEHEVLRVLSSVGDLFSCRFRLASDPSDLTRFFRYENHSQDGTFQLLGLTWITFGASTGSSSIDTVTFSGFGAWVKGSHRSLRQISAQVCTNPNASYVGIQIDTGDVSNVNTKPVDERLAYP